MISTIASSYEAAADLRPAEAHSAWRMAWTRLREDYQRGKQVSPEELSSYLADVPFEDQKECLFDLIAEHLRLYSRAGIPQLEDYVVALGADFPWLLDIASWPADLIEDEFIVRSTPPDGDYPRLKHYFRRFGARLDVMQRLARRCLADQRYIKLRVLGVGALGVVYEAYDSIRDRLVAVKEVSADDQESMPRLEHEMEIAAALCHPGIVAAYGFGKSDGGDSFYAMELVAGRSLSDWIGEYHAGFAVRSAAENRRELRSLAECVVQMCEAVAHAHERGILHRDLKPGNVIVRETGEAVIVDWGLARRYDSQSAIASNPVAEIVAGTPQYMAPEQVERRECQGSDIFSLGATLYEVLTGQPPHRWNAEILESNWPETIRHARIVPPRRLASSTPRQLDAICMKALAKGASDRHGTAAVMAADLRTYLASEQQATGWLNRIRLCFR